MTGGAAQHAASLASVLEGCHIWRAWLKDIHVVAPVAQQSQDVEELLLIKPAAQPGYLLGTTSWQRDVKPHWLHVADPEGANA